MQRTRKTGVGWSRPEEIALGWGGIALHLADEEHLEYGEMKAKKGTIDFKKGIS